MDGEKKEVKPGIYKHFKGGEYQVYFNVRHSETEEELVVYKKLDDNTMWARSKDMFLEDVDVDGKKIKRFEFSRELKEDDYKDKYLRALADYQNLLKQTARDKEEFAKYANEQLILEILPAYDNLKISLAHVGENGEKNGWTEGIKHVIGQFAKTLQMAGVEEIKTVGEKFDHNTMEAVESEETDDKKKDGVVARELAAGYKLNGKVIKAARVVVYQYKK